MELKVKLQKSTNKKQEEKKEFKQENGYRELSDDKLNTINFFPIGEWISHSRKKLGGAPPPPPFQKIYQKYVLKLNQH